MGFPYPSSFCCSKMLLWHGRKKNKIYALALHSLVSSTLVHCYVMFNFLESNRWITFPIDCYSFLEHLRDRSVDLSKICHKSSQEIDLAKEGLNTFNIFGFRDLVYCFHPFRVKSYLLLQTPYGQAIYPLSLQKCTSLDSMKLHITKPL